MKAYKLKNDYQTSYGATFKKNRIFIDSPFGGLLLAATPTCPTRYGYDYNFVLNLLKSDVVEEIDIKTQKWIHPHLIKQHKIELLKDKNN